MPHGPAIIRYNSSDAFSFFGIGVFNNGKLHMGPFTAFNDDMYGYSFTKMINGRPVDSDYYMHFFPPRA